MKKTSSLQQNVVYLAWLQALAATLGSLFYSEIMHLAPCVLCWYQRILMYPLVWIIGVGLVKKDRNLPLLVIPLSSLGAAIALFHYLLQIKVLPDAIAPCAQGISCTDLFINYFGFITIPFMSLIAFTVITISMIIHQRSFKKAA